MENTETKTWTTEGLEELFDDCGFKVTLTTEDEQQCAELETYTEGGVNMIIWLNPFQATEFISYVDGFDVDEEIELHREMKGYKQAFSLRQSLDDFEGFHQRLKNVVKELECYN